MKKWGPILLLGRPHDPTLHLLGHKGFNFGSRRLHYAAIATGA